MKKYNISIFFSKKWKQSFKVVIFIDGTQYFLRIPPFFYIIFYSIVPNQCRYSILSYLCIMILGYFKTDCVLPCLLTASTCIIVENGVFDTVWRVSMKIRSFLPNKFFIQNRMPIPRHNQPFALIFFIFK